MSIYKGGVDPKTEQWARRHKNFVQNDTYKNNRTKKVGYGRRGNRRDYSSDV